MADVQVTCVLKTGNNHQSITHLGGPGGQGWCWTKQDVINSINNGSNTFFTLVGGVRANVHVVNTTPPYVQTYADGQPTNNLLALPACR
jgi:hypothetical protein